MVLLSRQELLSSQARRTINDGKAPKEDPDAEFEFREDIKKILLEALGARKLPLDNYVELFDQIYSPTSFKPKLGQDYLFDLRKTEPELATELFAIFQCVQELDHLRKAQSVEKCKQTHRRRRHEEVAPRTALGEGEGSSTQVPG